MLTAMGSGVATRALARSIAPKLLRRYKSFVPTPMMWRAGGYLARAAGNVAARRIQARWRRYYLKKRKRGAQVAPRNIKRRPDPPGQCRQLVETTYNVDTLYVDDITALIDNGAEVGDANREYIDVVGIKLCHIVKNVDLEFPIVYHMALLEPKYGTFPQPDAASLATEVKRDFWTAPTTSDAGKQTLDFDSVSITRVMKNCLPISTQRYKIWLHKKCCVMIGASNGGKMMTLQAGGDTVYCDTYTKINTRYYRKNNTNVRPLLLVRWMEPMMLVAGDPDPCGITEMNKIYHKKTA